MNIVEAIKDERLFRPIFKDFKTWSAWLVLLKAFFALEMSKKEFEVYKTYTGRSDKPKKAFGELWVISGRRGGKSQISAIVAVYLSLFCDFQQYLSPGERAVIQIIAADRNQAKIILSYIKGIFEANPVFGQYVTDDLKEAVHLSNSVSIEVMSAGFRAIRGRSVACVILDEIAFFYHEGSFKPDHEIVNATRPGLATFGEASKLIAISSPYSRSGVLWEHYERYYGKPDKNILVWQAPTRAMNPTISQEFIDSEMEKDKAAGSSEWYGTFRQDITGFLDYDLVHAVAVLPGELAPEKMNVYQAFVDPSGGRSDEMTLAIGHYHYDRKKYLIDVIRGWSPPFDPSDVVEEIAQVLKRYRCHRVCGDRYAANWVTESFKKCGIIYSKSELTKSKLFLEFEPLVNTKQVQIPKEKKLINELLALERRTGRSGRDAIDHPPKGSDDRANAVAGCCHLLTKLEDSAFRDCDLG